MIPISEPKANNSEALYRAACNGHLDCVQLLIPVSDPKAYHSYALCEAARYGHTECIRILIPVSIPKDRRSLALQMAVLYENTPCVDLLFDVSEPDFALHALQSEFPNEPHKWQNLECKIVEQQKNRLNAHVIENSKISVVRKL